MILLAAVFFIADFIVLNMVDKKVLILDFVYFFKGKIKLLSFVISFCIAFFEELLFRYFVFQSADLHPVVLLIASSLCFGAVHIVFSKYDAFSKTVLGAACGMVYLMTDSIFLAILFHGVYNYFTLKDKTSESEVYGFGN